MSFSSTARRLSSAPIINRFGRIRSTIIAWTAYRPARSGCSPPRCCSSSVTGGAAHKPTHLAMIFDKTENSFRRDIYPQYKAHRKDPPDELVPQFPLMRATVSAFGMVPIEQGRYEADDIIATYARQARQAGADVLIVSADQDLMELVQPGVSMDDPASAQAGVAGSREERRFGVEEVVNYFEGVGPDKVVDVQALAGDSTDNVPGAPGIGLKTAAQLILEYGDLETLLARAGEIKQPK